MSRPSIHLFTYCISSLLYLTSICSYAYTGSKTVKQIPDVMRASEERRQKDITLKPSNVENLTFEGEGDGYAMFAPANWSALWPELK